MDFSLSDETRMVVDTVRRFVRDKVQPLEQETEELGRVPPDKLAPLKAEAIALGLYALNMPAEVGGGGLSVLDMCLVEERICQCTASYDPQAHLRLQSAAVPPKEPYRALRQQDQADAGPRKPLRQAPGQFPRRAQARRRPHLDQRIMSPPPSTTLAESVNRR